MPPVVTRGKTKLSLEPEQKTCPFSESAQGRLLLLHRDKRCINAIFRPIKLFVSRYRRSRGNFSPAVRRTDGSLFYIVLLGLITFYSRSVVDAAESSALAGARQAMM